MICELLLGCGANRSKKLVWSGRSEWADLTTLDFNADHRPDVVWDLDVLPLPFDADHFDEVHAYDVLEHLGRQGDWRAFLALFAELWRILKPGGVLLAISPHPASPWAWGDPGHTRVIGPEALTFLHQPAYDAQLGKTAMTDYRFAYRADFDVVHSVTDDALQHQFVLQAVKPSRCSLG